MGNCIGPCYKGSQSKIIIKDYNKINIPHEYKLIKIATCNVNIKNTVNLSNKIKDIISYFTSDINKKTIDILCLQGVYDSSLYKLISEIKRSSIENNIKLYFSPPFDDIDAATVDHCSIDIQLGIPSRPPAPVSPMTPPPTDKNIFISKSEIELGDVSIEFNKKKKRKRLRSINTIHKHRSFDKKLLENKKNKFMKMRSFDVRLKLKHVSMPIRNKSYNIIISKDYPIVEHIHKEIDESFKYRDILGKKTIIGANISVNGNIISVYNTALNKNIKTANIINSKIRDIESKSLFEAIQENKYNLQHDESYNTFVKTNIHLLLGSLNINEYDGAEEFAKFIQNYHCIDIFRYINDNDMGYTNTSSERLDYIFYLLTDDIYDDPNLYKKFTKINTSQKLFEFILNKYGVYFFDIYVVKNIKLSENYPIECVFMIDLHNH